MATETIARANADGQALPLVAQANSINESLYDNLSFNFVMTSPPSRAFCASRQRWSLIQE